MSIWSWIKSKFTKDSVESAKSGPYVDTKNHGRVYFPAKGKFVQESHYATNMEKFAHGLFPSSSTEKIDEHLKTSFELLKKQVPNAVFENVYSDRFKREWTPANDGGSNEYGQAARGNVRPAPEEEIWQGNMFFKNLPAIGTKFLITAPNGLKCVIQMGYEIGPGGSTFLGGLTTEVHYYLGTGNDSILTIDTCDQSLPLGPYGLPSKNPEIKPELPKEKKETPWLNWFIDRLGWTEYTHDKELSKGWALSRYCKNYKTVIGKDHSWCGISGAMAMQSCGYKYPLQCETAFEWIKYGTPIDWKKDGIPRGAIIVLKESHLCFCYEDHKPGPEPIKRIGGNQSNAINVKDCYESDIYAVRWPLK